MNISIDEKKLELIKWVASVEDIKLINLLSIIKGLEAEDDHLSEEEIASIEAGLRDLDEGKTTSHSTVMEKYAKYL